MMAANKLQEKGVQAGGFDLLPTTLEAISKVTWLSQSINNLIFRDFITGRTLKLLLKSAQP